MIKYLFKNYISPFKWRFALGFILLILGSFLNVLLPKILMEAIDRGVDVSDENQLIHFGLVYLTAFLFYIFSLYFMAIVLENLGQDILIKLKTTSFYKVLNWDYHQFTKYSAGNLVSRIERDAEKVRFFFTYALVAIVQSFLMFLGMIFLMGSENKLLTLIVIAPLPLVVFLLYLLQKFVYPKFKKVRKIMAEIMSKTTEYLRGLDVLKVFNREKLYFDKYDSDNENKFKLERNIEIVWIVFFNFIMLLTNLVIAIIFKVGAPMIVKGILTYGAIVMFIEYVRQFFFPLIQISEQISQIQRAIASFSRIYKMHSKESKIKSGNEEIEKILNSIEFENVNFSYKVDEPVLKNISFKIPKGEKWAIVGETGSGKSTLIKLLLRFYDVDKGRVLIDGTNIRDIKIKSLRKDISLIEQDFYLFPATVIDNIRLFDNSITKNYIKKICKAIKIDGFIENLPRGYDTYLREEGSNLSVGEKQLLSIARAMVKEADLVLLDEATSSIDPHTEKKIDKAMNILLKDKTSIIIAHRLNTILDADKIIVLHEGKILEIGNHRELYKKEGYYYNLCQNQFVEKLED
ncbi:MAG: ABC transporter ATP-binding protein [Candidatus Mcinerneyibacterium aminivorans]|uniref:ABC transporter ATP-binding protein n=1 Tax=Candidatus Mcinerneyibacterium aminivorans TaxID=2703815 RepID=A0A5D0MIZ4_9BACT|nr:MAG: ABC transporter ATP-binding protein [Candidatus Mcinerneyibacterium aminivorans]